jgi:hypothetical protein
MVSGVPVATWTFINLAAVPLTTTHNITNCSYDLVQVVFYLQGALHSSNTCHNDLFDHLMMSDCNGMYTGLKKPVYITMPRATYLLNDNNYGGLLMSSKQYKQH